jgi:hypothetical protein
VKNLMLLWQRMAADAAIQCCTSATKDINTVLRRYEHEGIEVLTLSLPEIGKAFERSLDQGRVTDDLLSLTGGQAGFPVFLRNFLQLVFVRDCGLLLDNPSTTAIQAVRQLTLSFGKVRLPCSDAREAQAFADFVKCEQEMHAARFNLESGIYRDFERISNMLFGPAFTEMDRIIHDGEIVPKHGPGATADKLRGNAKYRQVEWTNRLETLFPAMENIVPSARYHSSLDDVDFLDPETERPVRVVSVPKTHKTPRIIAVEPTCIQYLQQGLMERLVELLESPLIHNQRNLAHAMVGFSSQVPNQDLAREGSLTGELATLDLSEASDRVPVRLVQSILFNYGHLLEAVLATRSTRADVPGHGVISLTKFASMGSALTFPIEEIVFLTTIFYGIEQSLGRHISRKDIVESYLGRVRVYGDDIIIPTDTVPYVVSALELIGSKVNHSKSFWTGRFRESCGKEYYDGDEVTIFRVRHELPAHRDDAPGVIPLISLRNQAYFAGYWGVARYLDTMIERDLKLPFPVVESTSPVLGKLSFLMGVNPEEREDPHLQVPLVKGLRVRVQIPASPLEDEFALLKWFLKRGREPFADANHLERQGRPRVVGMKLGWSCPY